MTTGEPDRSTPDEATAVTLPSAGGFEAIDLTGELGSDELPRPAPALNIRVAERREGMRGILAGSLVAILAATTLLGFASVGFDWATPEEARELLAVLLTPIVGLVGAATGFYFGGNTDG